MPWYFGIALGGTLAFLAGLAANGSLRDYFLRMRRAPVTRLDVAWAFAWPLLATATIAAAIIWAVG